MNNRTVIVILVIAAALVGFIFFFERDTMTTSERKDREDRVFTAFKQDLVETLTIRATGGGEVALERISTEDEGEEERWKTTAPRALDADISEVRAAVSAIDFLLVDRSVRGKENKDDARYGLGSPRLQASFTIRGEKTSFGIGADAQGEKVYLGIDGVDDVFYAVDGEFLKSMDKTLEDLRSKKLVAQEIADASGVELVKKEGTERLRRKEDGTWQIETDGTWILAAEDQVSELVRAVGDLKAERFIADDVKEEALTEYGLSADATSITLQLPSEQKVTVRVGKGCPDKKHQLYFTALGTGTVICAKDDVVPVLMRPAKRLRETRVSVFRDEDISGIALSRAGESLRLEKGEEGWKLSGDDSFSVDQNAVAELLEALKETRASEIQVGDEAVSTLGESAAKIGLTLAGEEAEREIHLFSGQSELERARRGGEKATLSVPSGLIDKVRPEALAFRDRSIRNGDQFGVEALHVEGAVAQELEKIDGAWMVKAPVEVAADGMAVRKLAELLAEIKVVRYVAAKATAEHGLAKPFAKISARFADEKETKEGKDRTGSKEIVLELGAVAGDEGRFARLQGEDETVFVVGPEYEAAISAPLVARDLFQIDDADMVRLSLSSGGLERVFERTDETWSAKDGAAVDVDRLKRIITDFGSVKTVRAVAYGPAGQEFAAPTLVLSGSTQEQIDEDKPTVVKIGKKSVDQADDGYIARLEGLDISFILPGRIIDELIALTQHSDAQDVATE